MPAQNEIGARAATPDAPVQVIFVRLPADAPLQPGEPRPAAKPKAPVKGRARRSPPRGRKRKQETKKMIKTFLAIFAAVAVYIALGIVIPLSGHIAVVFPILQVVPAVGMWLCFLTYKGIVGLVAFSAIAKA